MTRLIDWVDEHRIPAIWSCLAAHAAVYYRDSIDRVPLRTKLSGVFNCAIDTAQHPVLHGLARHWRVPHSRRNGLSRKQLDRHGYDVLSWSREVAVDMFLKQERSLQLHLQGHPEYDAGTLIAEYRRDLTRMQHSGMQGVVSPPVGVWGKSDRPALHTRLMGSKFKLGGESAFDVDRAGMLAQDAWSSTACRLFSNWLLYLDATRCAKRTQPAWEARLRSA